MKTQKGILRTITTGIVHAKIEGVQVFLKKYLDVEFILTHEIPSACTALEPILKQKLSDDWFIEVFEKENFEQEVEVDDLTEDERKSVLEAIRKLCCRFVR